MAPKMCALLCRIPNFAHDNPCTAFGKRHNTRDAGFSYPVAPRHQTHRLQLPPARDARGMLTPQIRIIEQGIIVILIKRAVLKMLLPLLFFRGFLNHRVEEFRVKQDARRLLAAHLVINVIDRKSVV